MIAAGSTLTFTVRGTTEAAQFQLVFTPGMLRAAVVAQLAAIVEPVRVDVTTDDTVITGTLPWTYRADVQVKTRVAHASAEDVKAIVAGAFFTASGNMPTVTSGFDLDFNPPELSWKVVVGLAAAALVLVVLKID